MSDTWEVIEKYLNDNPQATFKELCNHVYEWDSSVYSGTIGYYYCAWRKKQHPFYGLWSKFSQKTPEEQKAILEDRNKLKAFITLEGDENILPDEFYEFAKGGGFRRHGLRISSTMRKKFKSTYLVSSTQEVPPYAQELQEVEFANGKWIMYTAY